jgi:uncharacterized membrane protein
MKDTYSIASIVLLATVASFLGFVVENVWLACTKGYIDNRNMNLPFLLGYGVAIVSLYATLGVPGSSALFDRLPFLDTRFKRWAAYFLCSFLFVCVAEVMLGTFVEKTCHIVLWNYSRFSLHLTKYTSMPTSTGFAFIITVFMDRCFTPIMEAISSLEVETVTRVSYVCGVAMVLDFCVNSVKMFRTKAPNLTWKVTFRNYVDDERTALTHC